MLIRTASGGVLETIETRFGVELVVPESARRPGLPHIRHMFWRRRMRDYVLGIVDCVLLGQPLELSRPDSPGSPEGVVMDGALGLLGGYLLGWTARAQGSPLRYHSAHEAPQPKRSGRIEAITCLGARQYRVWDPVGAPRAATAWLADVLLGAQEEYP